MSNIIYSIEHRADGYYFTLSNPYLGTMRCQMLMHCGSGALMADQIEGPSSPDAIEDQNSVASGEISLDIPDYMLAWRRRVRVLVIETIEPHIRHAMPIGEIDWDRIADAAIDVVVENSD